mgnify:CR=1 FL=1
MNIKDLKFAAKVHYSFLPHRFSNDWLDIAVIARPFDTIGGDFCSIVPIDERHLVLCVCDAVGHGVASALYAARINTFVLSYTLRRANPCQLITSLNGFLCQQLSHAGMYASFFIIFIDCDKMEFQYAGAAHPPALHLAIKNREIARLESQTTLLGIEDPMPVYCPLKKRSIAVGDKILLYTDGLSEARNRVGEEFGDRRLLDYMKASCELDSTAFSEGLLAQVRRYGDHEIKDDVLIMCVDVV